MDDPPAAPAATPHVAYHYDLPAGPLPQEELWRPREAEGIAKVVLEQGVSGPLADVNPDGVIDARDVALRSASPATGPAIEAGNTLGRLAWVRDQSGEEHLSYDARGRAVWKIKRFRVRGETGLLSFHVENAFDSMDRLTRHVYPDGAHVDYAYNARGLLGSVAGAIDQVKYNPTGQPARIDLANGVGTQLEYDNRLRLHRSTSVRQADSIALKHLDYAYDEVSHIAAIADRRSLSDRTAILAEAAPSAALSPTDIDDSFAFAYDSLYRLTTAAGPGHGVHTYRFDPIGNMLSQGYNGDSRFAPAEQGGMRYGDNGHCPQALTRLQCLRRESCNSDPWVCPVSTGMRLFRSWCCLANVSTTSVAACVSPFTPWMESNRMGKGRSPVLWSHPSAMVPGEFTLSCAAVTANFCQSKNSGSGSVVSGSPRAAIISAMSRFQCSACNSTAGLSNCQQIA